MLPALRRSATSALAAARTPAVVIGGAQPRQSFKFGAAETEKGVNAMSSTRPIITVFGATGHLGRYVVAHLGAMGAQVVCPNRSDEMMARHLRVCGDVGQILPVQYDPLSADSIRNVLQYSNTVINLIGRDYETIHWSWDDVHHKLTENIALLSMEAGIKHFVQISQVGADVNSKSSYLKSRALGEKVVQRVLPENNVIARLTHLFGPEDVFFNTYLEWAKMFPILPVYRDLNAKMQLTYVEDAALAIAKLALGDEYRAEVFELGGPRTETTDTVFKDALLAVGEKPKHIGVPRLAALPISYAVQPFPAPVITPDSVRHRYGQELIADNKKHPGMEELAVPLVDWDTVAPGIYRRHRTLYRMATLRSNHVVQHTHSH